MKIEYNNNQLADPTGSMSFDPDGSMRFKEITESPVRWVKIRFDDTNFSSTTEDSFLPYDRIRMTFYPDDNAFVLVFHED